MYRTSFAPQQLVRLLAFAMLAATVFYSCKKDETIPPDPQPPANSVYSFPITTGSYWIYQQYQTDSAGNITMTGGVDSVYVDGDTIIGAYTYKKIKTVNSGGSYFGIAGTSVVRDSAGYLVNWNGTYIEHDNFIDTLHYANFGGLAEGWFFMRHEDSVLTVPAGTFTTIDYESDIYSLDPNYPHPNPRHTHQVFASGIGKIKEVQYYYAAPGYLEKHLIAYHIQ